MDAWAEIKSAAAGLMDNEQIEKMQQVLSGWDCWKAEDLLRQRGNNGYACLVLLHHWANG